MVPPQELTRLVMAAQPAPFWLDRPDAPAAREPLRGDAACDLAVIGGGFSGLWTALLAKEANPGRSVVLIEGNRIGWAASGRNGGFCEASLTHGAENGRERFPAEFGTLQRLGAENLTRSRPRSAGTTSTATSSGPDRSPWPPRTTRSTCCAAAADGRRRRRSWTPRRCGPR